MESVIKNPFIKAEEGEIVIPKEEEDGGTPSNTKLEEIRNNPKEAENINALLHEVLTKEQLSELFSMSDLNEKFDKIVEMLQEKI